MVKSSKKLSAMKTGVIHPAEHGQASASLAALQHDHPLRFAFTVSQTIDAQGTMLIWSNGFAFHFLWVFFVKHVSSGSLFFIVIKK